MLSYGSALLYSFFAGAKKIRERMPMLMEDLAVAVSKKPLPKARCGRRPRVGAARHTQLVIAACCRAFDRRHVPCDATSARACRCLDPSLSRVSLKGKHYISFEVCCTDEDDEDVDLPQIRYKLSSYSK